MKSLDEFDTPRRKFLSRASIYDPSELPDYVVFSAVCKATRETLDRLIDV